METADNEEVRQLVQKQVLQKYIQMDLHEPIGLNCKNGNLLLMILDTISTLLHLKHS